MTTEKREKQITSVTVGFDPDSLFGGWTEGDISQTDVEASIVAYADQLRAALSEVYECAIEVEDQARTWLPEVQYVQGGERYSEGPDGEEVTIINDIEARVFEKSEWVVPHTEDTA